jgi:hypothetical protein
MKVYLVPSLSSMLYKLHQLCSNFEQNDENNSNNLMGNIVQNEEENWCTKYNLNMLNLKYIIYLLAFHWKIRKY